MADILSMPRKRRTRAHVIADISVNYVERFVYEAGFTAERKRHDYGIDFLVTTYDRHGYDEAGEIKVQVKATEQLKVARDGSISFRLNIADVNRWLIESMPVLLVLYEAATKRAYWLYVQRYFQSASSPWIRTGAISITVHIPKSNRLNRRTLAFAQRWKNNILDEQIGSIDHG